MPRPIVFSGIVVCILVGNSGMGLVNAQDSTLIVYILEVEGVEKHTQYATWFAITKHRS